MENALKTDLQNLVARLVSTAGRDIESYAKAPDTLSGRKAADAALLQLTHIERLLRLTRGETKPLQPDHRPDSQPLPPALAQAAAALDQVSDRELVAALAAARPTSPCACPSAPVLNPGRKAFRCGACGAQRSFLIASVLANTHVPFRYWFLTALIVSHAPDVTVSILAQQLGVRRLATTRRMLKSVRALRLSRPLNTCSEIAQALVQGGEPVANN